VELTKLRGFRDLIGGDARLLGVIEARARSIADRHNVVEVRIPALERLNLYARSTGETSDIVEKQLYVVQRSSEGLGVDDQVLRPEGTPGVVRAYIEAGLDRSDPEQRFFYCGPMFRYERPQKGRYREFYQFGVEFFAGWLTEYSLSVDNLFIFLIIMASFNVPKKYQQQALLVGIIIALVFRGIFLGAGVALVSQFTAVLFVFGYVLLACAYILQWLPWIASPRVAFEYHFFPNLAIICLGNAVLLQRVWRYGAALGGRYAWPKLAVGGYLALVVGLFAFFFPILAGLHVPWHVWDARMWHALMGNQWV